MTLFYPQLSTGAIAQFPFEAHRSRRTIVNECPDGSLIRYADVAPGLMRWRLRYSGLTNDELSRIQQLFNAARGRLNSFTFVDPAANLLNASEDLEVDCWRRDGLLLVKAVESANPVAGGSTELTNAAQTEQRISQTINAPAAMEYTFSFYGRSAIPLAVQALISTPQRSISKVFRMLRDWRRCVISTSSLEESNDEISFAVDLPAGAVVEVCGLQVEAKPGVSEYHASPAIGGVYRSTWFASDSIQITTLGDNNHSADIELISRAE